MEPKLKRSILTTVLLMLAAGGIPLLQLIPFEDRSSDSYFMVWLAVVQLFYFLFCLFIWIRGCTAVIWKLPVEKTLRMFASLAWLILYPALCIGWLGLCAIWVKIITG